MKTYFIGIFLGAASVLAAYSGAVAMVERTAPDLLPPPAITGIVPTDEKFKFLRNHSGNYPELLAVGSSVAWMHFDGAAIEEVAGPFLNGGTAHLKINQSRRFAAFYLDRFPGVRHVILATALADFRECGSSPDVIMNEEVAADYIGGDHPTPYYYLRYFAPLRYVTQAQERDELLEPYERGSHWMDRYGTTPIVDDTLGPGYDLRYDAIELDPLCLQALRGLKADLDARGVTLSVVLTPVNPRYAAAFPQSDAATARIAAEAKALGLHVLNLYDDPAYRDADFWDAFHLQWPAAQRMSRAVADDLSKVMQKDHAAAAVQH